MNRYPLSLIVALTPSRVIGRAGGLPWRLRSDLRRFRRLTMGHHVIMGRRTYESLPVALTGRHLVVLSRQPEYSLAARDVALDSERHHVVVHDWDAALQAVASDGQPFVIGGARLFETALPLTGRLYITLVHADVAGDTFFPQLDWSNWRLEEDEWHAADRENEFPFSFRTYRRRTAEQTIDP